MSQEYSVKDIVEQFQNRMIRLIEHNPDTAISQANTEAESSKDYTGRVVYEFFQNAVDRADKNIWMELTENTFIISNDGKEFSISENEIDKEGYNFYQDIDEKPKGDFHSLNSIHNGEKQAGESIGNKGVGFKSCWNVSEHVKIESIIKHENNIQEAWGFELFNPVKSKYFTERSIKNIIEKMEEKNKRLPSFYFPKYTRSKIETFRDGAVTKITIFLKDTNAYKEIEEELKEFKKTKFLFLNLLKGKEEKKYRINITIDNDDKGNPLYSEDDTWHKITLKEQYENDFYRLKSAREKENYKNIPDEPNIAIAFPPDSDEPIESKFYTYLPTKIECGFNILIHADFALDNARVSIPENNYNNTILEIAAKMLINELLNNTTLHNYKNFALFLMPKDKNDKFAKLVWEELIRDDKLTQILQKVYTKERNFPEKKSYELIFDVIDKWKRERNSGEWKDGYYQGIYDKTIQYFCNEEVFIVYIDNDYISYLPTKDKDEEGRKNKLFYIDENKNESKYDFALLKNLNNITLSSMVELNRDIFIKNNIVKENRNIEIYKALAIEMEKNVNLSEETKLKILKFIMVNATEEFNFKYFLADSKKKFSEIGFYLSRILLPTLHNGWQPAKQCYFNIYDEVSQHFSDFYEIDIEILQKNINNFNENIFKYFGVWDTIPITENFQLAWKDNNIPQIKDDSFKKLLQESLIVWKEIEKISKDEIKDIFTKIKNQELYYDDINNSFCKPCEVFLFDDSIKRIGIAQAKRDKDDKFKLLHEFLDINFIEQTKDSTKLYNQLYKLSDKDKNFKINKTHKTLYKQLVLAFSKNKNDYTSYEKIPLLTNDEYMEKSDLWFADRNSKKYMHYFELNYVLFDIETNKNFVKHFGVHLFEPEFSLKPDNAKENPNRELKNEIQKQFLPSLFCLAEEIMHINRFNKEEAISRWNNLKIGYAEDVWLEVKLNHNNDIKEIGKDEKDNDVLFKPLSYSQRQEKKENIGDFIHDLKGETPQDILENKKFNKFGYVIADGVFRDTALGSVFSDFLQTQAKKEFLEERGILDSDIKEMENFIIQSCLTDGELASIIEKLKAIDNLQSIDINDSNWFLINTYKIERLSFLEIENEFKMEEEKIQNIIKQLNPTMQNIRMIRNQKENICIKYYVKHQQKLSDEEFDKDLDDAKDVLFKFIITEQDINNIFKIENITEDQKLIARIEIQENIKVKISEIEQCENLIFNKAQQFNKDKKTTTKIVSEKTRLETSQKQQTRGLAYEKIFAIKQANKIIYNDNLFKEFQKQYKQIKELNQEVNFDDKTLQNIANIIQVSETTGDGLGYDVLELEINNDNLKINKVEIKSSKGGNTIHLSNNEIIEISKMKDIDNWRLYHFVDNKIYNRTVIKQEVDKLINELQSRKSSIIAESWIITFKE